MRQKVLTIGDNSGTRRRNPELRIWRNDITGMEPGAAVWIRFVDDYTKAGLQRVNRRKYTVVEIKFDDDYARQHGRHAVTLRREKEAV